MDVTGIADLATTMANVGLSQAVSIAVLKQANDIQAQSAAALIQAIPNISSSPNLPPHLGQNVNTTA